MKISYSLTSYLNNLLFEIAHKLGQTSPLKIQLSPSIKLKKANRAKALKGTLAIEGNTIPLNDVQELISGRRIIASRNELTELKNAIELYEQIESFDFSKQQDLLMAHKLLLRDLKGGGGQFRSTDVAVGNLEQISYLPPPGDEVQEFVAELFDWLRNSTENLLIQSCIAHYQIETIHPFEDGNGRIGRFWQSLILVSLNPIFQYLPVENLIWENRDRYYDVLNRSQNRGDCSLFLEFMLKLILVAITEMVDSSELETVRSNYQQRLSNACTTFQKSFFSRKDYLAINKDISKITASKDLQKAVLDGVLEIQGTKNLARYRVLS